MRLKICGITRYEDAKVAANLGVDALGFIFVPQSPRYISPMNAAEIIKKLPPFVSKVGVFADEKIDRVIEVAKIAGIDTVQLHGSETPEYCDKISLPKIKVFQVRDDFDTNVFAKYNVSGFLLDTWSPTQLGGTGKTFNWEAAEAAVGASDAVILSGGLGPTNILDAIESVRPYGLDVNSGVEISPGVKNIYKMKTVISIVKENSN